MSVSHELQNLISDVSVAIAERKSWGRTEQERVRRTLDALARDAAQAERAAGSTRLCLDQLITGVETRVADLAGLARRAGAVVAAGVEGGR